MEIIKLLVGVTLGCIWGRKSLKKIIDDCKNNNNNN